MGVAGRCWAALWQDPCSELCLTHFAVLLFTPTDPLSLALLTSNYRLCIQLPGAPTVLCYTHTHTHTHTHIRSRTCTRSHTTLTCLTVISGSFMSSTCHSVGGSRLQAVRTGEHRSPSHAAESHCRLLCFSSSSPCCQLPHSSLLKRLLVCCASPLLPSRAPH